MIAGASMYGIGGESFSDWAAREIFQRSFRRLAVLGTRIRLAGEPRPG
jgi:hypothetical protein